MVLGAFAVSFSGAVVEESMLEHIAGMVLTRHAMLLVVRVKPCNSNPALL